MAFEFKFPDVGEGIHEGEIVRWRVKTGDGVKEDQPLVEMETAKAIVELPSPKAGVILAVFGKEGEIVHVGATLVVIGEKGEKWEPKAPTQTTHVGEVVLPASQEAAPGVVGKIPTDAGVVLPPRKTETSGSDTDHRFDGPIERIPLHGIRKTIAAHMAKSKSRIPHVTHMDEFDATELIKLRESQKTEAEKQRIKLTYLAFIVKTAVETLKKHPALNAEIDDGLKEIIYKKYYNIAIAVDTPDGLMAPVIKNADQKDVFQIAKEITDLAQKCRDRKITPAELQGGTFTITNIGSVGGIMATPIIIYGQSANLGVYRMKEKPVVREGKIEIWPIMTLTITYDHRIVDGAEGARFMNDLVSALEHL